MAYTNTLHWSTSVNDTFLLLSVLSWSCHLCLIFTTATRSHSLSSKFNLPLLQSQYPNLYPVINDLLNASDDHKTAKWGSSLSVKKTYINLLWCWFVTSVWFVSVLEFVFWKLEQIISIDSSTQCFYSGTGTIAQCQLAVLAGNTITFLHTA